MRRSNRAWLALVLLGAACGLLPAPLPPATSTLPPATWTPAPPPPTPVITPQATATSLPADSGWQSLRVGLDLRFLRLFGADGRLAEEVTVVRIDPAYMRLDVAYRPGAPLTLEEWRAETEALIVVNGGYYTEEFRATGLVISGGQVSGTSYGGFAGMLAVDTAGNAALRWLAREPYDPAESLQAALQSFPLLVQPGGVAAYPDDGGEAARRTVMAMDQTGRFLFVVAPFGYFSLHALSQYLVDSDLAIDLAINLDGGASSGLLIADPPLTRHAFSRLPTVIAVYPREP